MLKKYLFVFFVSMVPVLELRGAIPIGLGMGLEPLPVYLIAVIGNMLPVPFASSLWSRAKRRAGPWRPRRAGDW